MCKDKIRQFLSTGNLGAAKIEIQEIEKKDGYAPALENALDTNSPELLFHALKNAKDHLDKNDIPLMIKILEKDFSMVIHGEDVVAVRRIKNDVSEVLEKITNVKRDLDQTGNVINPESFAAKVKQLKSN